MLDILPATEETPRDVASLGAVDCDVHPRTPQRADLLPFLSAYWKEIFDYRGVDRLELTSYPTSTKPYGRPELRGADENVEGLRKHLLDPLGLGAAILNVVGGVQAVYDPYMARTICEATNRWLASEWLDKDDRLRATLLVPFQHPEAAAEEIRRYADDRRFVQVLAITGTANPLGQRFYWPIYKAAAEAGFALQLHPGSAYRHSPTQLGFPSFLVEEHAQWTQGFANQMVSLLTEGVLDEFRDMKLVLAESGVSWLFAVNWRLAKEWRGIRVEVPWVKDSPEVLIERQVRLTVTPFDAPPDPDSEEGQVIIDCLGSPDMLLYSSDFPHAYPEPLGAWPRILPFAHAPAICRGNALATYPRLELPQ